MTSENKPTEVDFKIRLMKFKDIKRCLDIWKDGGLTEGHCTAASQLAVDRNGFHVAYLPANGKHS